MLVPFWNNFGAIFERCCHHVVHFSSLKASSPRALDPMSQAWRNARERLNKNKNAKHNIIKNLRPDLAQAGRRFFRILCASTGNLTILTNVMAAASILKTILIIAEVRKVTNVSHFGPIGLMRAILCDKIIESAARWPIKRIQVETGQIFPKPS